MRTTEYPDANTTIQQLLKRWPEAGVIFIRRRMACIGCRIAAFETLEEAARIYDQDLQELLRALKRQIQPGTAEPSWPAPCLGKKRGRRHGH